MGLSVTDLFSDELSSNEFFSYEFFSYEGFSYELFSNVSFTSGFVCSGFVCSGFLFSPVPLVMFSMAFISLFRLSMLLNDALPPELFSLPCSFVSSVSFMFSLMMYSFDWLMVCAVNSAFLFLPLL